MRLKTIFEEMEVVLNELNEQFETIREFESGIPQIEIDIMMSNIRKLYENMSFLNRKMQSSSNERVKELTINKPTAATVNINPNTKVEQIKADHPVKSGDVHDSLLSAEKKNLKTEEADTAQTPIRKTPSTETKQQKSKAGLLLQFEDELFSINESVARNTEDKSLVNRLGNTRIDNLKTAIGINDKFFLINQLFNGNPQAYEDVIYTLNNFKRIEEAMQYTSTLKYRYDWDTDTEAYLKLVHFLERKFLKIEV